MPRICSLQRDRIWLCREHDVDDVGEGDIAVVRAFIVAPAEMHTQLFGRDVGDRMIERFNVQPCALAKVRQAQIGVLNVPAHGEVRAIDLQDETGLGDRFVFVTHGVRNGVNIALEILVVIVAEEQRHHPGRCRAHETTGNLYTHSPRP